MRRFLKFCILLPVVPIGLGVALVCWILEGDLASPLSEIRKARRRGEV